MNTHDTLREFKNYLTQKTGVRCYVNNNDLSAQDYPCIQLIPEGSGSIENDGPRATNFLTDLFPCTVKIISERKGIEKALQIKDYFTHYFREFQQGSRHTVSEEYNAEFTENTYEITFNVGLRIRIQNTQGE